VPLFLELLFPPEVIQMREFTPSRRVLLLLAVVILSGIFAGCAAKASERAAAPAADPAKVTDASNGATIDIETGGPADTVRVFYKRLRDRDIRAAMYMTNMRPAIEGLTDTELKEFSVDFEKLAVQVPADLKINGEIVSGDRATVTIELPAADKPETQTIRLRRQKDVWVLMSVDEAGERRMKADGKQYFYNLRIDVHHEEAEAMLRRIAKGELVYSAQNQGVYADLRTLVGQGLIPDDATSATSTGYVYTINLDAERKTYYATATPVEYGKSGKLSFLLDGAALSKRDTGGTPLTK